MNEQELQLMLAKIEAHKKKVTSSKKAATEHLIELGIFSRDGQLTENYRELCIPPGQA